MIYVVGLGPGGYEGMTQEAVCALEASETIVGYKVYIEMLRGKFAHKELIPSPMTREVDRCRQVLELARGGRDVALVSSGDAGIYGMSGIMLEIADGHVPVSIVPGVTAACSAGAVLGAPLMHDFAVISLSDLLTPWELIERRLEAASSADFVICIYNPCSRGRPDHLSRASRIVMRYRHGDTPSGWVRNAGRDGTEHGIVTLDRLPDEQLDMFCTVFIGNSATRVIGGRLVTPRGYGV